MRMQIKRRSKVGRLALLAVFCAGTAVAGPKWKNLGDYTAGGGHKEIVVNRHVSEIAIDVKEGRVIINTLLVREADRKQEIIIGKSMNKGDKTHFVKLDGKRQVVSIRVVDDANGRYRISVK